MKYQTQLLILQFLVLLLITGCSSTRTYQRVNHIVYPEKRLPEQTRQITVLHTVAEKDYQYTSKQSTAGSPGDILESKSNEFGPDGKAGYMANRVVHELRQGKFYLVQENKLTQSELKQWDNSKINDHIRDTQGVLVVLEDLKSDYDFKSDKIKKHQLDQDGNDYYIDAYEASRRYLVQAEWDIYHGNPFDHIYRIKNLGEKWIKTQGLNKDQTIAKLDSISQGIERFLLDSLAQEFSRQILPKKILDSWSYYAKGSDELEKAGQYMKLDKLEEAKKIYQSGLKFGIKPKIEARLNYNLAILQDIGGYTTQALIYAERALLTDDKYLHQNLYNELKLKKEIEERP